MYTSPRHSGWLCTSGVAVARSDADLVGPAVEHRLVPEHLEALGRAAVPDQQQQITRRSPHRHIAFGVLVAHLDGAVAEPDEPLALAIGGVEMDRPRHASRHTTGRTE